MQSVGCRVKSHKTYYQASFAILSNHSIDLHDTWNPEFINFQIPLTFENSIVTL